jgi:hypothetical protein
MCPPVPETLIERQTIYIIIISHNSFETMEIVFGLITEEKLFEASGVSVHNIKRTARENMACFCIQKLHFLSYNVRLTNFIFKTLVRTARKTHPFWFLKSDRQGTYNATWRRVHETDFARSRSRGLVRSGVLPCLSSMQRTCAILCFNCELSVCLHYIFPRCLINSTIFGYKVPENKR